MRHPFEILSPLVRRWVYWFLFAGTIALAVTLQTIGNTFAEKIGPTGRAFDIIDFELAHTSGRAAEILDAWGAEGIEAAKRQTYLDFLFLIFYSNTIALGVVSILTAAASKPFIASIGRMLAYAQWVAGLCDAVENVALLRVLAGHIESPWPQMAFYFAYVKFGIIILGLLYVLTFLPFAGRRTESDAVIGMGS